MLKSSQSSLLVSLLSASFVHSDWSSKSTASQTGTLKKQTRNTTHWWLHSQLITIRKTHWQRSKVMKDGFKSRSNKLKPKVIQIKLNSLKVRSKRFRHKLLSNRCNRMLNRILLDRQWHSQPSDLQIHSKQLTWTRSQFKINKLWWCSVKHNKWLSNSKLCNLHSFKTEWWECQVCKQLW